MAPKTEWYQDNYLVSTAKSLIQPAAVNAAFGSEDVYWARKLDDKLLQKMINNCLCFGIYELPDSSSEIAGRDGPRQIGLARLITDEVTFAYITDVYILKEHQGKGLGSFLIKCVDETLSSWPELRGAILIASQEEDFYGTRLDMAPFDGSKNGLRFMQRKGPAYGLDD